MKKVLITNAKGSSNSLNSFFTVYIYLILHIFHVHFFILDEDIKNSQDDQLPVCLIYVLLKEHCSAVSRGHRFASRSNCLRCVQTCHDLSSMKSKVCTFKWFYLRTLWWCDFTPMTNCCLKVSSGLENFCMNILQPLKHSSSS